MEAGEKDAPAVREGDPQPGRLRWVVQPALALLAIAACFAYTNTRELTSKQSLLQNDAMLSGGFRHLWLTAVAALLVIAISVPLGVALTRGPLRRHAGVILAFAGFGQAAPAVGLVVLAALYFGVGIWPFIGALTLYGILPVVANVVAGLNGVDQRLVEAGRGMGMSAFAVLRKVELPIAVPVMLTGVRTALVLMCGTAAFGGFVGAGGLGALINTGIKLGEQPLLLVGAVLIASLALLLDWIARVVEVVATPKGL
ncbi:ABC transporter permease [Nocardioides hwasunensis]|uniref:ABC transporter permease n=2 Tax=Nocardioides hwasunensis TaxID=397258 RepID=A0ABR8MKE9_9ACTN|nr:ABC transporter permease [Nocardioides hwasunensis]